MPKIIEVTGQNYEHTYYQQDGAAPHNGRNVAFQDRWIGRRGSIEWPARSADLTPLNYFLWGYLKERIYKTKPQNIAELQQRIIDECALISRQLFINAINSFYNRIGYYQQVNGYQFNDLL